MEKTIQKITALLAKIGVTSFFVAIPSGQTIDLHFVNVQLKAGMDIAINTFIHTIGIMCDNKATSPDERKALMELRDGFNDIIKKANAKIIKAKK